MGTGVTLDSVGTSKTGEAQCSAVLGLISTGDCSVQAAMNNGGIKKVHHIDYRHTCFLGGVFWGYTTIVYGE